MSIRALIAIVLMVSAASAGCVATQGDVSSVYARQTRLEARMDRLSRDMQSLNQKEATTSGTDVELREKVFQLEQNLRDLNDAYSKLSARVNQMSLGSAPAPTTELGSQQQTGPGPVSPTAEVNEADVIFNNGYTALGDGNYEDSRAQFKEFLAKYPKSPKASDATYWVAESYYREGEFEESILEYQKFIDTYPKDGRVPLAYLKQGLSLVEIGKNEEAQLFFQTLIDKYPNSDEARTAKEKITELAVER